MSRVLLISMLSTINDNHRKLLSAIVFFLSYAFLLHFMDLLRNGISQNFILFWLLIVFIFTSAMYQIFRFGRDNTWQKVILFQVILIAFFFQIILVIIIDTSTRWPGGGDAPAIFNSALYILSHTDFLSAGPDLAKWPGLQLQTIVISEITNISLRDVAIFTPPIYGTLGAIFTYFIARELYSDVRVALLAYLAYSPFYYMVIMHHWFHFESMAFIFFMAGILVWLKRLRKPPTASYSLLAILFVVGLALTHYLTSFFLVAFVITVSIYFLMRRRIKSARSIGGSPAASLNFALIATVITLGYWVYIGQQMLYILASAMTNLGMPFSQFQQSYIVELAGQQLRYDIRIWASRSYTLLFGAILLYEVLWRRDCRERETDLMLISWVVVCALLYVGSNIAIITMNVPFRILIFTYPFILMIVSHTVLKVKHRLKKVLLAILILGFVLFNAYSLQFIPEAF